MLPSGHNIQEPGYMHLKIGLFQAFALCRTGRIFTRIDESCREAPIAAMGFIDPPDEQNPARLFNQDRHRDFWVVKIDPITDRAGLTERAMSFLSAEMGPATRAVVDFFG